MKGKKIKKLFLLVGKNRSVLKKKIKQSPGWAIKTSGDTIKLNEDIPTIIVTNIKKNGSELVMDIIPCGFVSQQSLMVLETIREKIFD